MLSKSSVIAGGASKDVAEKLARKIKANLIKSKTSVFADGESKITLGGTISKERAIVVQSIYPPVDTNLIQALSLVAKAKEISSQVIIVVPYMGYARQDREFLPGEIVTMKVLGKLFKGAGASKIITVDIHSMIGLRHFSIKTENVSAIPELAKYFKKLRLQRPLVVSPDQGGKDRAKAFAKELGLEYIALVKKRDRSNGRVKIITKNAKVEDRDLIIVDDMISTGGSILECAKFLRKQKCKKMYVACTHALLINDAAKRIKKAGVVRIVSSNTIPGKTSIVDISNAVAKAL